jgi:hypothetical protein
MGTELQDLADQWRSLMNKPIHTRKDNEANGIIASMCPLVETLMIRFTVESKFLGRPVVKVPKNVYKEIFCTHNDEWAKMANDVSADEIRKFKIKEDKRLKEHQRKGLSMETYTSLSKSNLNTYYRSRVIASFPFLSQLRDENGNYLKLTGQEWLEHTKGKDDAKKWVPGTDSDLYSKNLKEICASSGKLAEFKKILTVFSPKKFGMDAEGKPTRHLICSYSFVVRPHPRIGKNVSKLFLFSYSKLTIL